MAIVTPAAGAGATGARETVRQKRERDQELLVWPDLVFVEFICAMLFTLTFVLLSVFLNAPLLNRANADITPNPSKAPWYLMNLQEFLLHMDAGLAGVIVPTVLLIALAAVPYIDRSNEGQGGWFLTPNAVRITVFSFFYSAFWIIVTVLWDNGSHVRVYQRLPYLWGKTGTDDQLEWLGDKDPFAGWPGGGFFTAIWDFIFLNDRVAVRDTWQWSLPVPWQARGGDGSLDWPQDLKDVPLPLNGTWIFKWDDPGWMPGWIRRIYPYDGHLDIPAITAEYVMPIAVMIGLPILMILILRKIHWAHTTRDAMIALFTGFIVVYFAFTIIGAAFRGKGQQLVPFWDVPNLEENPAIQRYAPPPETPLIYLDQAVTGTGDGIHG